MQVEKTGLSESAKAARRAYMKEYRKNMTDEQKQKERDYQKQWRERNEDRTRQHQESYWMRKAAEMKVEK